MQVIPLPDGLGFIYLNPGVPISEVSFLTTIFPEGKFSTVSLSEDTVSKDIYSLERESERKPLQTPPDFPYDTLRWTVDDTASLHALICSVPGFRQTGLSPAVLNVIQDMIPFYGHRNIKMEVRSAFEHALTIPRYRTEHKMNGRRSRGNPASYLRNWLQKNITRYNLKPLPEGEWKKMKAPEMED